MKRFCNATTPHTCTRSQYARNSLGLSLSPLHLHYNYTASFDQQIFPVLTSLGRGPVDTVLGTVSLDELVVAGITAHGEGHLQDVVAALHQHQDSLHLALLLLLGQLALHLVDQLVLGDLAGPVEEVLDHVEELGVGGSAHILQPVGDLVVRVLAG